MSCMVMKIIKKYFFLILAVIIAVGGYFYILSVGSNYRLVHYGYNLNTNELDVYIGDGSTGEVEILGWETFEDRIEIDVRSTKPGRVFIDVNNGDVSGVGLLYIHKNGVITNDLFFGDCTGFFVVNIFILIYLLLLGGYFIMKYRKLVAASLYSYDNILYMGLIIFTLFFTIAQIFAVFSKGGLNQAVRKSVESTGTFVIITFPVVLITTIFVTISNVQLIKREGKTWRNMLAFFLCLLIGIGAYLPFALGSIIYSNFREYVSNWRGVGRFIEMFLENSISALVTYLECILLGSIICSTHAARHIPKYDKDYILILGCQVRKDGTLTKLLQSRTDRAVEFAKLQKEAAGKDIIFVPSGGKGSDEVISEGEAIRRYLLENGIPEDQILAETGSTSTEENFRFSKELIAEHHGSEDYKCAFSTTNYHVFRSGMLAEQQGLKAEGIGSKTKRYFWINAFVREFIATIYKEKKTHVKVCLILLLINVVSTVLMYLSEAVLS